MTQNQFETISKKIDAGERISDQDALFLFESDRLVDIGHLADKVNRRKNNEVVYYNINRHINPTNICTQSCKFCAYAKKPGEPGAYEYTIEEMLVKAQEVVDQGATEVHMVGGLHPRWKFSKYVDIIRAMKTKFPELHIKAFTAVELDWMAKKDRRTVKEILEDLVDAGLGSLPGGGAEIFHQDVRDQICAKSTADRWLEIHKLAHDMGLHSNCTMLYGHVEKFHHRVDHMRRLRELQDQTNGFNAFIPLSFQPQDNDMGITRYTLGYDDLKTIAIARLYLDNFQHIKAYWIMLGQDIAQIALNFGANDLDGTVTEEKISRAAGGRSGIIMGKNQIEDLIRKSGNTPCERDTVYKPLGKPELKTYAPNLESLLYKAENGVELSEEEWDVLVQDSRLLDLADLASRFNMKSYDVANGNFVIHADPLSEDEDVQVYKENLHRKLEFLLKDQNSSEINLVWDLKYLFEDWESGGWNTLLELIKSVKADYPQLRVECRGWKSIWKMTRSLPGGLEQGFQELHDVGVKAYSSSHYENESDVTEAELSQTIIPAINAGFEIGVKAELHASFNVGAEVFWQDFLRRLQTIRSIADEHRSATMSLVIEADQDGCITPVDFLKAISIARVICKNIKHQVTDLSAIPVSVKSHLHPVGSTDHHAMKYAPVTLHFGSDELGGVDLEKCDIHVLLEETRRSGISVNQKGVSRSSIKEESDTPYR